MNRCISTVLAVVLAFSPITVAQRSTKPGPLAGKKVFIISGEVRDEGRSLVSDEINKWTVDNSDILKGKEGSYLAVRCHVDSDKHTIHILSINVQQAGAPTMRSSDSAFRR
jgi:hypothetical protein